MPEFDVFSCVDAKGDAVDGEADGTCGGVNGLDGGSSGVIDKSRNFLEFFLVGFWCGVDCISEPVGVVPDALPCVGPSGNLSFFLFILPGFLGTFKLEIVWFLNAPIVFGAAC